MVLQYYWRGEILKRLITKRFIIFLYRKQHLVMDDRLKHDQCVLNLNQESLNIEIEMSKISFTYLQKQKSKMGILSSLVHWTQWNFNKHC